MTKSTRKSNQKLTKDRDFFDAELIIADSEKDPNMLYAAGLFAPDPFFFLRPHDEGLKAKEVLVTRHLSLDSGIRMLRQGFSAGLKSEIKNNHPATPSPISF